MKKDMNSYYAYGAAIGFVLCAFLACFYGQPMLFMQNQLGLNCVGCVAPPTSGDTWNGECTSEIIDECCVEVYCPTCRLAEDAQSCTGDCPVPPQWPGWTGSCELFTPTYGFDCKCVYIAPHN